MIGKTLVQQIRIISCCSNNMSNVIKGFGLLANDWQSISNDNTKIALVNHL